MMKRLQKLGKSLMLPVAALPVGALLMGIGYWIDPTGWGANSVIAAFLLKAGGAVIDNMGILFAIGVSVGLADDNDGTAALAGMIAWLTFQSLLAPKTVSMFMGMPVEEVNAAFSKTGSQFFGILAGVIGGLTYNKFKGTKLPDFLSFFSGKRSVAIVTSVVAAVVSLIMLFVWPIVYQALVNFGLFIIDLGALGAGIYAFFNRLLIPTGLHHALNSVFWFDVAGINDIARFWGAEGFGLLPQTINGVSVTGIYMTGFFPVMMFGLPGAALAMWKTAKTNKRKVVAGLLLSAALASFFTGITEPLEFAFMFLAPALFLLHAALTGVFVFVAALLPVRSGFNFSAGFVDWILGFKAPGSVNPLYIILLGIVAFVVYYFVFKFVIEKFDFKTPGREADDVNDTKETEQVVEFTQRATVILDGLGGKENIRTIDNCITRLRLELVDASIINESKINEARVAGIVKAGKNSVQVIIGPQVQFVADELKRLAK